MRQQNDRLDAENRNLLKQLDDLRALQHCEVEIPSASELKIQLTQTEHELARAKEALSGKGHIMMSVKLLLKVHFMIVASCRYDTVDSVDNA